MNPVNWMFDRRTRLVIDALAILATRRRSSAEPMMSRDIWTAGDMPIRYLEPTLQRLVKANILAGVRGPKGGYRLAEGWETVSFLTLLHAIEPDGHHDPDTHPPAVGAVMDSLNKRWCDDLAKVTLQQLAETA